MDGLEWKTLLKWMIWGYHYFRKHPCTPPKINMELKNGGLEDELPLQTGDVQVPVGGVTWKSLLGTGPTSFFSQCLVDMAGNERPPPPSQKILERVGGTTMPKYIEANRA